MAASREDIKRWLEIAKKNDCTHLIVVTDTYDWDEFPVYVSRNENVYDVYKREHGRNMQVVQEVYNLDMDIEQQLSQFRVFNF